MGDGDSFAAARSNLPELSLSLSLSLNYFSSGLASSTTVLEQSSLTKQERKPFTDKNCFLSAYKNLPPRYVCIEARLVSNVKSSWTLAPPPL